MNINEETEELWLLFEQDGLRSLDEAEQHLLALESASDSAADLNGLYRALHSLKGNARVMGLSALEGLTHKTEDLVGLCRDGVCALSEETFEAVLEAADVLREVVPEAVADRGDISADRVAHLVERLAEMVAVFDVEGARDAASDSDGAVFDDDMGIDIDFDFDFEALPEEPEAAPEPEVNSASEGASAPALAAAPEPSPRKDGPVRRDAVIQVRSSKIQELLSIASDLGLSTDSLLAHPGITKLREESEDVTEQAHRLRRLMRDLRFSAAGLALVPVNELFAKVRRMGRDLGRQTGKNFDVILEGEDTEIDKSLVDALSDPVLHIIRNAIDHGIETPEERAAKGKSPKGRLVVSASYSGNEVLIVFSDDGKGLDTERIREKALARGLISDSSALDDKAINQLIFHPGFSTKESVSELSGRGVGMDVVNESIKGLRGRIDLDSVPGQGTSLAVYLPLTLAFADALVVEIGKYLYAVPLESVGRIFLPTDEDWVLNSADGVEYLRVKSKTIPVVWLTGAARRAGDDERRQPVVTVRSSAGEIALPVDLLRGTEQITMRPLDRFSREHPAASSCGILSNGDIAMTLDCERLATSHTEKSRRRVAESVSR